MLAPIAVIAVVVVGAAPAKGELGPAVKPFVSVSGPRIVLTHARIIDGTGAAPLEDRNVTLAGGKIVSIDPGADVASTDGGVTAVDLTGRTVLPGIVGMHNHLFYVGRPNLDARGSSDEPVVLPQMTFSSPRLYLGCGVTTMRTTGSVEPYADLGLKRQIDDGVLPGPHLDVTAPYLEGSGSPFIQMPALKNADDARQTVDFWADRGATSFKAYMNITRAELKAAIDEAHKRGFKVTGHLCSVSYPEAAELGIDNLEHGFVPDTEFDPEKKPDVCSKSAGRATFDRLDPTSAETKQLFATLVKHHVALTSTLAVFEGFFTRGKQPLRPESLEAMTPEAREAALYLRGIVSSIPPKPDGGTPPLQHEMELERAFVASGGTLLAGPDPTGAGDVVPGFGDQREIELLVAAGFSPVEAIKIATLNGAVYLGRDKQIGSIAAGKNADLMVVKGDPSKKISDLENVELVFKDGVGFDSKKLLGSVRGRYGAY